MEVKTQVDYLRQNHFQDGAAAYAYMQGAMASTINRTELRAMNRTWDDINMLSDVGVQPHSVRLLLSHIRAINGERPTAPVNHRKTNDEIGERLLECIIDASKHFSESATTEYNATAGQWAFEHAAGTPLAGQRNVDELAKHYDGLWKAAVDSKLPGFHIRAPAKRAPAPSRQTMEVGNVMGLMGRESPSEHELANMAAAGGLDIYVPRSGSPHSSLVELGNAGHDLASRRGTTSTTDWTMLNGDELCQAAEDEGCDNAGRKHIKPPCHLDCGVAYALGQRDIERDEENIRHGEFSQGVQHWLCARVQQSPLYQGQADGFEIGRKDGKTGHCERQENIAAPEAL